MGRPRKEPDESNDAAKAKVTSDAVGWQVRDEEGRVTTHTAFRDEVVEMPSAEFDRLKALGHVEKAGRGDKLTSEEGPMAAPADLTDESETAVRAAKSIAAESEEPENETERQ